MYLIVNSQALNWFIFYKYYSAHLKISAKYFHSPNINAGLTICSWPTNGHHSSVMTDSRYESIYQIQTAAEWWRCPYLTAWQASSGRANWSIAYFLVSSALTPWVVHAGLQLVGSDQLSWQAAGVERVQCLRQLSAAVSGKRSQAGGI